MKTVKKIIFLLLICIFHIKIFSAPKDIIWFLIAGSINALLLKLTNNAYDNRYEIFNLTKNYLSNSNPSKRERKEIKTIFENNKLTSNFVYTLFQIGSAIHGSSTSTSSSSKKTGIEIFYESFLGDKGIVDDIFKQEYDKNLKEIIGQIEKRNKKYKKNIFKTINSICFISSAILSFISIKESNTRWLKFKSISLPIALVCGLSSLLNFWDEKRLSSPFDKFIVNYKNFLIKQNDFAHDAYMRLHRIIFCQQAEYIIQNKENISKEPINFYSKMISYFHLINYDNGILNRCNNFAGNFNSKNISIEILKENFNQNKEKYLNQQFIFNNECWRYQYHKNEPEYIKNENKKLNKRKENFLLFQEKYKDQPIVEFYLNTKEKIENININQSSIDFNKEIKSIEDEMEKNYNCWKNNYKKNESIIYNSYIY